MKEIKRLPYSQQHFNFPEKTHPQTGAVGIDRSMISFCNHR